MRILFSYMCCACLLVICMIEKISCCIDVTDEYQARQCLNLSDSTNVTTVPLPIELTSNVRGDFLCDDAKPYAHTFTCTHFGEDLLWFFNGRSLTSFQNGDPVGRFRRMTYPESPAVPLFNITAVLIEVDNGAVREYKAPFCISSLTVYPYDLNNVNMIPFNVSCRTHCADVNFTEVCQVKEYNIAAKPDKPTGLTKEIRTITANNSKPSTGAVISFNWNSSENNYYSTFITNYKFTLIYANTSRAVVTSVPLFNSSYTQVVTSAGRYIVSVSAIDLCGQESEPATMEFEVKPSAISCDTCICDTQEQIIHGLISGIVIVFIAAVVIISIICIVWYCRRQGTKANVTTMSYGSTKES